jgi:hypothetical protein
MAPSIYLVNIGANSKDGSRARSPLFDDGSFIYVSFVREPPEGPLSYSADALPFVRGVGPCCTHADPDWANFSYGDKCSNPRASALMGVEKGDILLFWGLLWRNRGSDWSGFTGDYSWHLFGALSVEEIVEPQQSLQQVSVQNRKRASCNAHFARAADGILPPKERIFLGTPERSRRFTQAVDLGVNNRSGLVYRAFTSANGCLLTFNRDKPTGVISYLRSCRRMWDLGNAVDRARATIVRDAILRHNNFDLLEDV